MTKYRLHDLVRQLSKLIISSWRQSLSYLSPSGDYRKQLSQSNGGRWRQKYPNTMPFERLRDIVERARNIGRDFAILLSR
jgi:hypothetical protein